MVIKVQMQKNTHLKQDCTFFLITQKNWIAKFAICFLWRWVYLGDKCGEADNANTENVAVYSGYQAALLFPFYE